MSRRAFTLIELLVVIAIIAILAAILFPVFAQAKRSAKGTQSLSNMRNIAMGVQLYLQDNDDLFHDGTGAAPGPFSRAHGLGARATMNPWTHWPWYYAPYVKSAQIFDCPLSPDPADQVTADNWGNDGNYGYNYDGLTRDVNTPARAASSLDDPAGTFAVFTSGDPDPVSGSNNYPNLLEALDVNLSCGSNLWTNGYNLENAFRYRKKMIVVFADVHVKPVSYTVALTRKGDNVAPWMIEWSDCNGDCPPPVMGPGQCFDPARLPD